MTTDELTQLPRRDDFFTRLQAALAQASQHTRPIALVYIDLDHLLQINSDFGHVAGDQAIRRVGEALLEASQDECFAARIGGDEFVLIVPGQSLEQVRALAQAVCAAVSASPLTFEKDGGQVQQPVSVSAGIAFLAGGEAALTTDDLVRRAYEAVLRAKESGGGSIQIFSEAEERDALTGALKKAGVAAHLDKACSEAERARSTVAVVSIDIDNFAQINIQFGRYTGDEVLRQVASALTGNFKAPAVVGRLGGDEFIVILPGARSETAFVLAEEVRKVIEDNPVAIQAGDMRSTLPIRISGGVAEYPSDGSDWRELIRKADEALYRSKQLGRNRICLPVSSQMVTKTAHFTQVQLEKLSELARRSNKSEAYLLREALDDLLRKYDH